jgi:hypothetical protein
MKTSMSISLHVFVSHYADPPKTSRIRFIVRISLSLTLCARLLSFCTFILAEISSISDVRFLGSRFVDMRYNFAFGCRRDITE